MNMEEDSEMGFSLNVSLLKNYRYIVIMSSNAAQHSCCLKNGLTVNYQRCGFKRSLSRNMRQGLGMDMRWTWNKQDATVDV
uniref:Uncharacterized protein n=1 Tax=Knipowitschia caucasica TaxID=637954 RepID=A0AAV2K1P8_KNICA